MFEELIRRCNYQESWVILRILLFTRHYALFPCIDRPRTSAWRGTWVPSFWAIHFLSIVGNSRIDSAARHQTVRRSSVGRLSLFEIQSFLFLHCLPASLGGRATRLRLKACATQQQRAPSSQCRFSFRLSIFQNVQFSDWQVNHWNSGENPEGAKGNFLTNKGSYIWWS